MTTTLHAFRLICKKAAASRAAVLLCAAALQLIALCAFGQATSTIPPSPEAAQAFKFAEVPVSLYAGLASTSVELCRVEAKGVTVPVTVSYHGRGVRVDEIASQVGLGWSLSYGGMVSRQVRSKPDDFSDTYGMMYQRDYNQLFTDSTKQETHHNLTVYGWVDETPDQFFLDLNGESAKFTIDPTDREILLQKFDDTEIRYVLNSGDAVSSMPGHTIIGWIVRDRRGNTYYYGVTKDRTTGNMRTAHDWDQTVRSGSFSYPPNSFAWDNADGGDRSVNTWHLLEVETYLGDKVEFFYEEESPRSIRRSYDQVKDNVATCYFSEVESHQQQIREIRFTGGRVAFTRKAEGRKDLTGSRALDRVSLLRGQDTVRAFAFHQGYRRSTDTLNVLEKLRELDTAKASDWRMYLDSLQEVGAGGASVPPYRFAYNPLLLPSRFSNSQDNWGYYNGKPNGRFLTFFNYQNTPISREVDTLKAEAGLLTGITYPTGGSVAFAYEHNKAVPPYFIRDMLYPDNNPTQVVTRPAGIMKLPRYYHDGTYTDTLTIGANVAGLVHVNMNCTSFYGGGGVKEYPDGTEVPIPCDYRVFLENESGYSYPIYYENIPMDKFQFAPGRYTLKVIPPPGDSPTDSTRFFYVTLGWEEEVSVSENRVLYAAGKRIRRIEYRTPEGTVQTKEYAYAGGRIFGLPNFYFLEQGESSVFDELGFPVLAPFGSMPGSPLTSLQGNSVGYAQVTEYFGDRDSNHGKTVHEFTVTADAGAYYKFPYTIPIDNEWLRGMEVKTTSYKADASAPDGYSPVKRVLNFHKYAGDFLLPTLLSFAPSSETGANHVYSKDRRRFYRPYMILTEKVVGLDSTYSPPRQIKKIIPKVFYLTGGTVDLYRTTETDCFPDGRTMTSTTTHAYDYDRHYLPAGTETSDSQGRRVVSSVTYPLSLEAADRTYEQQALVELHRHAEPLASEARVLGADGEVLASTSQRTGYGVFGGLVLPDTVENAVNGAWREEARFERYDAAGNPLQAVGRDGVRKAYVWGHGGAYPIAEALQAQASQVFHTSFEEDGTAGAGAKTGRRFHQGNYRFTPPQGFASAAGSTLSYWSWSAAAGKWRLVEQPYGGGEVDCTGDRVDEVRIYPPGARMTTYTYDPLVGMTSATDANGRTARYEYDGLGRLRAVRDDEGNVLKTYEYGYAGH